MKSILHFVLFSLIRFSSAVITPDEKIANVVKFVEWQISYLLHTPNVARDGGGIKCYDKYLPLITAATEHFKSDSEACISRAASRYEDELNKVKTERETLDDKVKTVQDTLSVCLQKEDGLEYLECLKENSAYLQSSINEVGMPSSSLSDILSASYKNIDNTEDSCISSVITKSLALTDELFAALKNCLLNGLDDGSSDGGSYGGFDGSFDGDSDGGSYGSSDGESDGGSDGSSDGDTDNGSNAGSDAVLDGGSDAGLYGGFGSDSDESSDAGSDGGSDAGSEPNPENLPEEDIQS